jgi:hypothetical protein
MPEDGAYRCSACNQRHDGDHDCPGEPDIEAAKERVFTEADREVWVVERSRGSGWRVSAVFSTYDDADDYAADLRVVANNYPEDFPERFESETEVRIRHGSRKSGTEMFESYPPCNDRSVDTETQQEGSR